MAHDNGNKFDNKNLLMRMCLFQNDEVLESGPGNRKPCFSGSITAEHDMTIKKGTELPIACWIPSDDSGNQKLTSIGHKYYTGYSKLRETCTDGSIVCHDDDTCNEKHESPRNKKLEPTDNVCDELDDSVPF